MDSQEASKILFKNRALRALREKNKLKYQIADRVLEARLRKNMTQAQLARKIGTKQPSIARIENGDVLPSLFILEKIGKALGIELIVKFDFMIEEEKVEVKSSEAVIALTDVDVTSLPTWTVYPFSYRLKDNSPVDNIPAMGLVKYSGGLNG